MSFPKFDDAEQAREYTRIYLRRLAYMTALMKRGSLSLFDNDKIEELKGEQLDFLRRLVEELMYDTHQEYMRDVFKVKEDDSDCS